MDSDGKKEARPEAGKPRNARPIPRSLHRDWLEGPFRLHNLDGLEGGVEIAAATLFNGFAGRELRDAQLDKSGLFERFRSKARAGDNLLRGSKKF